MTYASACLTQEIGLVRKPNIDTKIVLLLHKRFNLIGKMMHIDYYFIKAGRFELSYEEFKHCDSAYRHQSLRKSICKRFESCAKSGSKNKYLHKCSNLRVILIQY